MLSKLGAIFFRGLMTVLPIGLTIYMMWWLGSGSEALLGNALKKGLPDDMYLPGMGLVAGFLLVLLVGVAVRAWFVQKLLEWFEQFLQSLPVVKTLYGAVSDFLGYFSKSSNAEFNKVVLVDIPALEAKVIGFVTSESLDRLQAKMDLSGHVAVYMPMSYQIGGYTLLVEPAKLTPVDMPFEDAMRFAVTAGISK